MVKPGYKQTEVGEIPEDWLLEPLENFTSFISYGFTNPMPTVQNGIHMITAKDINNGRVLYSSARQTSVDAYNNLLTAKSRPKKDDILLTKDGTLGRVALAEDIKICINQSVAILRPNNRVFPLFFKVLLESPYYQLKMIEDAGGSTIKHIYITIVNQMNLGLPRNIIEQESIAKALSDVDELIVSLEKLIAKKRDIKTAAMQQLLTGKKRLPGFGKGKGYKKTELGEIPEDWDVMGIGQVATVTRGASPRPIDSPIWFDSNSTVGWLRISDVTKTNKYLYETTQNLSEKGIANSRFVSSNNMVMSICATVGRPILTCKDVCIHDGFVLFSKLSVSTEYLYYVLSDIEEEWSKHGQTGSQMNLNTGLINNTCIPVPSLKDEQDAIARVLSDIDVELSELDQRLNKTKSIKQGMMQELLTGRTRLVAPQATEYVEEERLHGT